MACSSCNKRKIVRQSSNLISVANTTYNNDDFLTATYVGPTSTVIGSSTSINYGLRETNTVMLVHNNDFNDESSVGLWVINNE